MRTDADSAKQQTGMQAPQLKALLSCAKGDPLQLAWLQAGSSPVLQALFTLLLGQEAATAAAKLCSTGRGDQRLADRTAPSGVPGANLDTSQSPSLDAFT